MGIKLTDVIGAIKTCISGLIDLLLPQVCHVCGAGEITTAGLCESCNLQLLSLVSMRYCPRCGATVAANLPVTEDGCWLCPNPLPRFTTVTRLGPYAATLRQAVQGFKYRRRDAMRLYLGQMLAQALESQHDQRPFDLVMPVAMHWRRRLARGYDHAKMLAGTIAGGLNLPLGNELIRVRNTPPQVHLPRSRRIENIRGAFAVTRDVCIKGAHVLLVDDVTTTGATANEASRILLKAGATKVTLAVIAKAEPPRAYAEGYWNA